MEDSQAETRVVSLGFPRRWRGPLPRAGATAALGPGRGGRSLAAASSGQRRCRRPPPRTRGAGQCGGGTYQRGQDAPALLVGAALGEDARVRAEQQRGRQHPARGPRGEGEERAPPAPRTPPAPRARRPRHGQAGPASRRQSPAPRARVAAPGPAGRGGRGRGSAGRRGGRAPSPAGGSARSSRGTRQAPRSTRPPPAATSHFPQKAGPSLKRNPRGFAPDRQLRCLRPSSEPRDRPGPTWTPGSPVGCCSFRPPPSPRTPASTWASSGLSLRV